MELMRLSVMSVFLALLGVTILYLMLLFISETPLEQIESMYYIWR